ncbi:unnamed protein product [Fraxinus pennsylvanica]|uniref:UDP-glycosyltransferase n=1 Tax=Fraxinus pennsylvanica TaxID=56036 RepID=A0AAD1Z5I0_9LAMI|nr:unnamed protein product [Fraxinus pennsylvanica]
MLHLAFQLSSSSFSDIIKTIKPDLLIYDLFTPWAATLASSLGIPAVFLPHHILLNTINLHMAMLHFPYQAIYERDYEIANVEEKLLPVGPLVTQPDNEEDYSEIMHCLSKKNQFSTSFIFFGSENYLSWEQIEEMARGLELCDVNFIWLIRFPAGETSGIQKAPPEGFLERAQEKGMIVQGWAP